MSRLLLVEHQWGTHMQMIRVVVRLCRRLGAFSLGSRHLSLSVKKLLTIVPVDDLLYRHFGRFVDLLTLRQPFFIDSCHFGRSCDFGLQCVHIRRVL